MSVIRAILPTSLPLATVKPTTTFGIIPLTERNTMIFIQVSRKKTLRISGRSGLKKASQSTKG